MQGRAEAVAGEMRAQCLDIGRPVAGQAAHHRGGAFAQTRVRHGDRDTLGHARRIDRDAARSLLSELQQAQPARPEAGEALRELETN